MPREYEKHGFIPVSTMKRCTGIQDTFTTGFILPMWTDLAIRFEQNKWDFQFSDGESTLSPHDAGQWKYYADPAKFTHAKIISPWAIDCKQDIKWLYMKPTWHFDLATPINIVTGTLSFKYQHGTHINMMLPVHNMKMIIHAGQPMAHIIPLTDKTVELRHHYVTPEEYNHRHSDHLSHSFVKGYKKTLSILKGKECPFQR